MTFLTLFWVQINIGLKKSKSFAPIIEATFFDQKIDKSGKNQDYCRKLKYTLNHLCVCMGFWGGGVIRYNVLQNFSQKVLNSAPSRGNILISFQTARFQTLLVKPYNIFTTMESVPSRGNLLGIFFQ